MGCSHSSSIVLASTATRPRALELEGDGPGLILLHEWGDSADTWRPLLAELGARGRRAIAVDLPGFGHASRLGSGTILPQLGAFAGALVEDWAGDGEVVVVGNSLGGVTALRLAELAVPPFDFARVECPVLLVWGTRDRMVPHAGAQILLDALPRTRVVLLEGVGHCPQLEATERLLELLLPFALTESA